ncbi:MAG TPA: fumarylacetoacetate hydrolase family protein [Pseudomonadales bacterium]|nr:fumarylacetoacetate hydrolase family protein [Pseudomonadales bacterium]
MRAQLPLSVPGKIVCIGRNYAEHAKELNNPIPTSPLLFIKTANAVVPFEQPIRIPRAFGSCHHELEIALLMGEEGVVGVGLALDLTLRDLQDQLKAQGHPWEKAKAFDGACPLSNFVVLDDALKDQLGNLQLKLVRNGNLQQQGNSAQMLTPVPALLEEIAKYFTLLPGDVVLTGTPAGVGPLVSGDQLEAELSTASGELLLSLKTSVV